MQKFVFGALLLALSFVSEAFGGTDSLHYYNDSFLQALRSDVQGDVMKSEIRKTLRMRHVVRGGLNDTLAESCPPGAATKQCYGHTPVGYLKARKFLMGNYYLVRRQNDYAIREVYCVKEVGSSEFSGKKPGPDLIPDESVVNVEHTWPQSRFSKRFNKEEQKSDLHHLFPTDSEMNSIRSSFEFGEVERDAKNLKCPVSRFGIPRSGTEDVFEPPMQHKGNVARALFYFSVKYELPISPEEEATLRVWNREDPVDQEERERNEAIFAQQFSRNPFVDYPELADKISDF